MGGRWIKEHKRDYYYRLAKKEGYRSRAAYKLIEIQEKFNIIDQNDNVLDLGSFPGSWLQVSRFLTSGKVVGVDLKEIKPIDGVNTIIGDITEEETLKKIKEICKKFDVILSDASPKTTGIADIDSYRSYEIAMSVLKIADEVLRKGGNLVLKVFQSGEMGDILREARKRFRYVKVTKPKASKKYSREVYIVCKGFKRNFGKNKPSRGKNSR